MSLLASEQARKERREEVRRKEEIIAGQVTKEGCRNNTGLDLNHEDRKDPRSCENENICPQHCRLDASNWCL